MPCAAPVAKPAALTVAVAELEVLQVAEPVTFCIELSLNVAVAVSCWVEPEGIEGLVGVMEIEVTAIVTVKVVMPLVPPEVAVMVEEPAVRPDANPPVVMEATERFEEPQVTELVILLVVPLL